MATINVSTARQTLPAVLDRVENGEEISITRHDRVIAVLVHPDTLTARRAPEAWSRADELGALLKAARNAPLRQPAIRSDRAEELVQSIRADRSTRSAW